MKYKSVNLVLFTCALAFIALSAGCEMAKATCSITSLGWYVDNIDVSYHTTISDVTCGYYLAIRYSGSAGLSDIQYARVYLPGGSTYWSMPLDADHYDAANKRLFGNFVDSASHAVVPIGSLRAEIKLNNGDTSQLEIMTREPGTLTASGSYQYAYSDDYTEPAPSNYIPAVHRAEFTGASKNTTFSISFTVNDNRVYNGWVWFYDIAHTYVGCTYYFRNSTGGLRGYVNGGSLNTNGTSNTLTITDSDIVYSGSYGFPNVSECVVVLTDGAQFVPGGRYNAYDYRSFSARRTF